MGSASRNSCPASARATTVLNFFLRRKRFHNPQNIAASVAF